MSNTVQTHEIVKYQANVELLSQQKSSRLWALAEPGTAKGKTGVAVEQIGSVTARRRTTRYPDLTPENVPATRPWVFPSDWDWDTMVDSIDELRIGIDVKGKYVEAMRAAFERAKDDVMIEAFFATRQIGQTGATADAFPASQQVGVSVGGTNSDLNVPKLREAKRLFLAAETGIDESEMGVIAVTSQQNDALLNEIQVISGDYNWGEAPVLREGKIIEKFMGFRFVHSERLLTDGSGYRRVPVWLPSGMHACTWNGLEVDISRRTDKAGLPWQVYGMMTLGAVRKENAKVVEIKCAET